MPSRQPVAKNGQPWPLPRIETPPPAPSQRTRGPKKLDPSDPVDNAYDLVANHNGISVDTAVRCCFAHLDDQARAEKRAALLKRLKRREKRLRKLDEENLGAASCLLALSGADVGSNNRPRRSQRKPLAPITTTAASYQPSSRPIYTRPTAAVTPRHATLAPHPGSDGADSEPLAPGGGRAVSGTLRREWAAAAQDACARATERGDGPRGERGSAPGGEVTVVEAERGRVAGGEVTVAEADGHEGVAAAPDATAGETEGHAPALAIDAAASDGASPQAEGGGGAELAGNECPRQDGEDAPPPLFKEHLVTTDGPETEDGEDVQWEGTGGGNGAVASGSPLADEVAIADATRGGRTAGGDTHSAITPRRVHFALPTPRPHNWIESHITPASAALAATEKKKARQSRKKTKNTSQIEANAAAMHRLPNWMDPVATSKSLGKRRKRTQSDCNRDQFDANCLSELKRARFSLAFKEATVELASIKAGFGGRRSKGEGAEVIAEKYNKQHLRSPTDRKLSASYLYKAVAQGKIGVSPPPRGRKRQIPEEFTYALATHAAVAQCSGEGEVSQRKMVAVGQGMISGTEWEDKLKMEQVWRATKMRHPLKNP